MRSAILLVAAAACSPVVHVGEYSPCTTDAATDSTADVPPPSTPRTLVYVANSTSNTITVLSLDEQLGQLAPLQTIAAGTTPYGLALSPNRRHLYVANSGSNDITQYSVDQSTGRLRQTASFGAIGASSIELHPSGRWATVTGFSPSDSVTSFRVAPETGELIGTGSSLSAPTSPFEARFDVSGQFVLFATARAPFSLNVARINDGTGALQRTSSVPTGTTPRGVLFDPTGRFAYVANIGASTITAHTLDRGTGTLVVGATVSVASPRSLAMSRSGRTLFASSYAADLAGSVVFAPVDQSTGAIGAPTQIATGGRQTFAIGVAPSGRWLVAVESTSNEARVLAISAETEQLTATSGRAPCDQGPVALAFLSL